MREQAFANRKLYHEYKYDFEEIFKLPLKNFLNLENPVHLFTGFDIVAFDIIIKTPDGKSTKEFVQEKYGWRAIEIISQLIGLETLQNKFRRTK